MSKLSFDLRMSMIKKLVNYIAPKILRLSKGVQANQPQSKLIEKVWARLEDVLRKEVETGCFEDRNFVNLLLSLKEALIFLCEKDKYYRRWLGLLAMFMTEELLAMSKDLSYEEALEFYARPLGLSKIEFEKHKTSIIELYWSGYLYGLSLKRIEELEEISKARVLSTIEQTSVKLPSRDAEAFFRLGFIKREGVTLEKEREG